MCTAWGGMNGDFVIDYRCENCALAQLPCEAQQNTFPLIINCMLIIQDDIS